MKIEKKETDFEPVTITLQSQDELDLFYQVFRQLGGDVPATLFGDAACVAHKLREQGAKIRDDWNLVGDIYIR